jgi:hypothetical protein
MSFETISLLLNWLELGVLFAILFRLANTFDLIANTQRELRRAIHHLGEQGIGDFAINSEPAVASASRSLYARVDTENMRGRGDFARQSP